MSTPQYLQLVPVQDSDPGDDPVIPVVNILREPQPLMSLKKTAEAFDVSENTIRKWFNRQVLPSRKCGKRVYLDLRRLEEHLDATTGHLLEGDFS